MAYMITEDCIACGLCEPVCENRAISLASEGDVYVINPDLCTQCVGFYETSQCAETCPWEACVPDAAHPVRPEGFPKPFESGAPDAA